MHGITLVFWGGYTETHSSERGPLASFLISAAGRSAPWPWRACSGSDRRLSDDILAAILGNLAFLSLLFAGLNALPGFPVDGGRMLLAVVWGITKDRFLALRVAGWGGVVVGAVLGMIAIQRLRAQNSDWLFFAFIGWMMIGQGLQVGSSHRSCAICPGEGLGGDGTTSSADPRGCHTAPRPRDAPPRRSHHGVPGRGRGSGA